MTVFLAWLSECDSSIKNQWPGLLCSEDGGNGQWWKITLRWMMKK